MARNPYSNLNAYRKHILRHLRPNFILRLWHRYLRRHGIETFPNTDVERSLLRRWIGIIDSMTPAERASPSLVEKRRVNRIARGSGTLPRDVKHMICGYETLKERWQGLYE